MPKRATAGAPLAQLNFRTTQQMRARLEAAANESGRPLAHEIEHRLQRSFMLDEMREIIREELNEVADSLPTLSFDTEWHSVN